MYPWSPAAPQRDWDKGGWSPPQGEEDWDPTRLGRMVMGDDDGWEGRGAGGYIDGGQWACHLA